jgi:tetratricopeptide (TPR) repeat protein
MPRCVCGQSDIPVTPQSKLTQAENLLSLGKAQEALSILRDLATTDPQLPGIQTKIGKAYFQSRQFPQAVQHLDSAHRHDPGDMEATQLLALSYYGSGQFTQAIPLLEKLGDHLPRDIADGPYLLGICYLMTERWDDARRAFARMFSVAPESPMAYLMLAKFLVSQKMEDRAVPEIEKALQLDPRLPMAHFLLGEIDLYKGNAEAGVTEFQNELAINPTIWLVYWRLGDAYARLQKYDRAEKALKEAIWLNESSSGAYIMLGQIYLKKGDAALATGFLERALKLDPQKYYVHFFLGKAYQSLGRVDDAKAQFEICKSLKNDQLQEQRAVLQDVH